MKLKEYRQANGLTQKEMVELLKPQIPGLTRPMYSLLERGILDVSVKLPVYTAKSADTETKSALLSDLSFDEEKPLKSEINGSTVIECLKNSNRPLSKLELSIHLDMSERMIRKEVEELRKQGWRVASSSHTKGYWLCENEADYIALRKDYMARIASMSKTVAAMDRNMHGQVMMNEIYKP